MEPSALTTRKRDKTGRGAARAVRRRGAVPAILYGRRQPATAVEVDAREFDRLLRDEGTTGVVRLQFDDGAEPTVALMKEIQREPLTHAVRHIDFHAVVLDEVVDVPATLAFHGHPIGAEEGGILETQMRELIVRCLPLSIPSQIDVDVSGLNIGDRIAAGDLALPEGVELVTDPDETVASLQVPAMEVEEEEPEAGEMPELVGEGEAGETVEGEAGEAGEEPGTEPASA